MCAWKIQFRISHNLALALDRKSAKGCVKLFKSNLISLSYKHKHKCVYVSNRIKTNQSHLNNGFKCRFVGICLCPWISQILPTRFIGRLQNSVRPSTTNENKCNAAWMCPLQFNIAQPFFYFLGPPGSRGWFPKFANGINIMNLYLMW